MLTFPPDWTFLLQVFLFLLLWGFLRRFLFAPHLAVLDNRERRSSGALQEASQVRAAAEELAEQYKTRLAAARAAALQQVDAVYRDTEAQSRQVVEAARTEAATLTATLRQTLRQELAAARIELEARVPDFSRDIAQKLLGRPLT